MLLGIPNVSVFKIFGYSTLCLQTQENSTTLAVNLILEFSSRIAVGTVVAYLVVLVIPPFIYGTTYLIIFVKLEPVTF